MNEQVWHQQLPQALCSSAMHYKWYYWMSMSNIQNDKITDTHKHAVWQHITWIAATLLATINNLHLLSLHHKQTQ